MARRYDSRTTTFSPEGRLYQARFDPAKTAKMNFVLEFAFGKGTPSRQFSFVDLARRRAELE